MPRVTAEPKRPFTVRRIDASDAHPLRYRVLRPHQTLAEMVYGGDDLPGTIHLGAFHGIESDPLPVGIVTLNAAAMPLGPQPGDWRLRGMAVAPDQQGKGIGRLLVEQSLASVSQARGNRLWCNARVSALGFYRSLGFVTHGRPFEIEHIGPHYVMSVAVTPTKR